MGRLELKLLAVLVLVGGVPLGVAFWLSSIFFDRSLGAGLNPAMATALEDAVDVYGQFVRAEKGRQREAARGLAASAALAKATATGDPERVRAVLRPYVERPRVFRVALWPREPGATPPVEVTPPVPRSGQWRREVLELPLTGAGPWATLRFDYGLELAYFERFQRMEDEVITPFRALESDRDSLAALYTWSFVGSLGATVLAASLLGVLIGRRVTRRLSHLRRAMEAVAAGHLETRLTPEGRDEVADLARGFNHMARQLSESQSRVRALTQLSAWQDIARRLAHEIKNPLTPILLVVQQAQQSFNGEDPRHRRTLDTAREVVEQEVENLRRLVESFSRFARLPRVTPRSEDLCAIASDLVAAHPEVVGLETALPGAPVWAHVDLGLLRQALTNLLQNAATATRERGAAARVIVRVAAEADGAASITVDDNGRGVPPEDRERIFEPYETGTAEGTGLGLPIVRKIALDHGGRVDVAEAPLGGARFVIRLPGGVASNEPGP